jgi:hypothetical protein
MAHTVAELEKMLAEAKAAESHREYPKYVKPHKGHVRIKKSPDGGQDHVSALPFTDVHVDRVTNDVTVLVNDADEEKKALAEPKSDAPKVEPVKMDPPKLVETPPSAVPPSEVKPT